MTIQELRKSTELSQSKFARHLEIPVSTLQHWEQGFRTPPDYVVKLIEKVLRYDGLLKE